MLAAADSGISVARTPGARLRAGAGRLAAGLVALAADPRVQLALLAFLLRLWWVLLVPSHPVGDFALYRESAAYLLDQGELDPEFVYMPGYVFLLAAVQAMGGGLLAAKMIGVVAGTAIVIAVGGIAESLFGRRPGLLAAALAALWPAGIAVSSVTGTDVPAGALVALGVFALCRLGPTHPWMAVVVSGAVLGLGAWVRAVAVPLAGLSVLYWLALGARWRAALARGALALAVAFVVLLPWAVRNRALYGELFFTDSHGGMTALVGANPNSEGTYSRSLNLMFLKSTGLKALESTPHHRASNWTAYALAKSWSAFEPAYALGLVTAKADRLLGHERNLLYWPVYRQGVLGPDARGFFDRHRTGLERLADGFWWALAALGAAGIAVSLHQRRWAALALLSFPLVLAGIYTLFFSEVRYHLAVVPMAFPFAAAAIEWGLTASRRRFRGEAGGVWLVGLTVALLLAGWPSLVAAGDRLRARHRWAIAVCAYPDVAALRLCRWRRVLPAAGDSPVRGVWDGVGLRLPRAGGDDVLVSAQTELDLAAGDYRVRAQVRLLGPPTAGAGREAVPPPLTLTLKTNGRVITRAMPPVLDERGEATFPVDGFTQHPGGRLGLEVEVESAGQAEIPEPTTAWLSNLVIEPASPAP